MTVVCPFGNVSLHRLRDRKAGVLFAPLQMLVWQAIYVELERHDAFEAFAVGRTQLGLRILV